MPVLSRVTGVRLAACCLLLLLAACCLLLKRAAHPGPKMGVKPPENMPLNPPLILKGRGSANPLMIPGFSGTPPPGPESTKLSAAHAPTTPKELTPSSWGDGGEGHIFPKMRGESDKSRYIHPRPPPPRQ